MRDPQPLEQHLRQLSGGTALRQVQALLAINRSLPGWCDEPWVRQLRIANLRDETVVVFSASAAALVPLRHRSRAFLDWLNTQHRLSCTRLEARVRPLPASVQAAVAKPLPRT